MQITGVKFFDINLNLFEDGASGIASSGGAVVNRCLDKNPLTKWTSVGSTDATTETLEITLSEESTIDRILLVDHNWKQFTVQYDLSGVWTDFTNVTGLDADLIGGISETAFAYDTAYYEFDAVTTSKIYITVTTTQSANQDKYLSQVITTTEIGTLAGYPNIGGMTNNRNERVKKVLSGKSVIQKSEETFKCALGFNDYGVTAAYTPDLDLMMTLFDREDPFLVWLCGGARGASRFRYTLRGFRLKDIYQMQIEGSISQSYRDNVYVNPVTMSVNLVEVV